MAADRNARMCSERLAFYCTEHDGRGDTGPAPHALQEPRELCHRHHEAGVSRGCSLVLLDLKPGGHFDYDLADVSSLK